jgi:hypothetical protein
MPALNFMARFADDVQFGIKRQSIRAPRKDGRPHCKRGDQLKLYTGMRSKSCRLLGTAKVLRVVPVVINAIDMYLDGRLLLSYLPDRDAPQTDNEFARADGFGSFTEMADWFRETHGLPFTGVVIYWGEPR